MATHRFIMFRLAKHSATSHRTWVQLLVALLVTVSGCSSQDDNSTPDPAAIGQRIEQIREVGRQRDFARVPELIDAMEHNSPKVRGAAIDAAEQVVGGAITFHAADPPERRQAAIATYRRLYRLAQEIGVEHLIDTIPALIDQMEDESEAVRRQAYEDVKRLTRSGFRFQPAGPPEQRQQVVERYRQVWRLWNQPGSEVLERMRDPEKMRESKRRRVEEIKAAEASAPD